MQVKAAKKAHKKPVMAKKIAHKTQRRAISTISAVKKTPVTFAFSTVCRKFSTYQAGQIFFTQDHEYVKLDSPDTAYVGISHHAQDALGDIVYIDNAAVGAHIAKADRFASVESVKASSDVFAPVSFHVLKVNCDLESSPSLVNESPEEDGWFAHVKIQDPTELSALMNKDQYTEFLKTCDH